MSEVNDLKEKILRLEKENRRLRGMLGRQKPHVDEALLDAHTLIKQSPLFREILDKVSDPFFIVNDEGEILYANRQFYYDQGATKQEHLKIMSLPITSRHDSRFFRDLVAKIASNSGETNFTLEYPTAHSDTPLICQCHAFALRHNGQEVFVFFVKDITDLSKARDGFEEMSALFDAILDNLPVYLFVKDVDNELRYLYWNKAFAEYSQIPASKVIGNTDFDVFPDANDAAKFRQDDLDVIASNGIINTTESYQAANGETRIVQTVKTIVPREGRGPLLIGISMDITNVQHIEQELVEARVRAEQSDRLKSAFLANMSHEIRTPLNAIVGFASLLTQTDRDPATRKSYVKIINENSEVLLNLIIDIIDISKIEAGTLEYLPGDIDVSDMMHSIYTSFRDNIPEDVQFMLEMPDEEEDIHIFDDRNRITQVLNNFLTNAAKFTKEGHISLGYTSDKDSVTFYVSDTGKGIDPEQLERIFERFVKLDPFAQGTGLGLSICKVIADMLHGHIDVKSELGRGSTFSLTIPRDKSAATPPLIVRR